MPNTWGIKIVTPNNAIGGAATGARNVISGNDGGGVFILGADAGGNQVQGNYIGTNASGTAALPNANRGIGVVGAPDNTIGGASTAARNLISGNNGAGIAVFGGSATGNNVIGNSIFGNTGLGIDLWEDGLTPNDPGDSDSGPNGQQNFPVIVSATRGAGGKLTVAGNLNSLPSHDYHLEFFVNDSCDPSGFGEGQTLLGTQLVTTDGSGNASFSILFGVVALGKQITATAGDNTSGGTSEFSQCAQAVRQGSKTSPTISTTLSSSSITTGTAVHDSATLTGVTGDAGGTVTYSASRTRPAAARRSRTAGRRRSRTGVVPSSDNVLFSVAGLYFSVRELLG